MAGEERPSGDLGGRRGEFGSSGRRRPVSPAKPRVLALGLGFPATFGFLCVAWAHATTRYFQHRVGRIAIGDHTIYSDIAVEWPAIFFEVATLICTGAATVWAIHRREYSTAFAVIVGAGIVGLVGLFFLADVAFWAYD